MLRLRTSKPPTRELRVKLARVRALAGSERLAPRTLGVSPITVRAALSGAHSLHEKTRLRLIERLEELEAEGVI